MKVLISGSHFTPAQAVIEELQKQKGIEIIYIGRKFTQEGDKTPSVESEILPKMGVKYLPLTSGRLQRSFTKYTIPSLLKIPVGFIQAFYYLLKERPQVILSFGGYSSVPVVICGWLLSIPVIIHEQTLVPGLANQISGIFAQKIALSFDPEKTQSDSFKSNRKVIITGNPIRKEILNSQKKDRGDISSDVRELIKLSRVEKLPLILITGGNQGSHLINENIEKILAQLTEEYSIIHQTGDSKYKDYDNLIQIQQTLKYKNRYLVKKWINISDFSLILSEADLAVSRAGINTLQELSYFGIPSILIPLPHIYKDEQNVNAKFFAKLGLAHVLSQTELTPQRLEAEIQRITDDLPNSKEKAKGAREIVILDAAKNLALQTLLLGSLNK